MFTKDSIEVQAYVNKVQEITNKHWEDMKLTYAPAPQIEIEPGSKYLRICKVEYDFQGKQFVKSNPYLY